MTNAEKALALHEKWNGKFETTPKMDISTREISLSHIHPALLNLARLLQKTRKPHTSIL